MSVKFAVLGHGVVGSGVVELFYKNRKSIEKRAGTEMDIKYILDLRDFPDSPYADKFTKNFDDILNDDEVISVAECMGGVEPAFTFVKACLEKGKSVSTSNKELVAEKGDILLKTAKEHNCNFFFEASVGGAIPIIRPLHRCLAANEITKVAGILNGTTNFILTKMYNDNMPFDEALKLAQELGYAEKDPTADIEGHDACRKICIISSLVFGKHVYPKSVYTKGIKDIQLCDVEASDVLGYAIKLVASVTKLENGNILPCVMPTLVSYDNIMSGVNDVFNAVLVYGDGIDQAMFYGRGAGKLPTASAVMGDVIEAVKHKVTVFSQSWESASDDSFVSKISDFKSRWYFRVPSGSAIEGVEVYNSDYGMSFVTSEELTFTQAEAKAKELGALACLPVLE
ncbi:homoserine dehydrogenase [Ruminococcus sp.]|uniref:homoserine dehydrogenase n=1 Tax=Ruminococcus sp. TaxID=41978 RepID=UPI0025EDA6ED|nr:homoserine dehydrogenase [Ruminococcus sp.]MBQ6252721.1 homoserine dehydrogenase [Ruminococcus sp.]MBR0511773.1 homoserine dehydrogenase [Ruminococcus sp.]